MPDPPRKRTVRVTANRPLAPSVYLLGLALPPGDALRFDPGQFVTFYVPKNGAVVTRSYSICSSPSRIDEFELCIKHVEDGFVSTYLSARRAGDPLNLVGPLGRFLLRDPGDRPVAFVSTGTGIAPFRPMLERLAAERPGHPAWLFAGYRYREDLLFHAEFEERARSDGSFRYVPVLSRPSPEWTGATGHVEDPLRERFPDLSGVDLYICGVPPMVAEVLELARGLGCPKERTFVERY